MLYGSRRVSKYNPHINVIAIVAVKIEYLRIVNGFLYPYRLNFFLIRPPILLEISCTIPRGHKKEQYVLPEKMVRIRTAINPAAIMVRRS
jgi:hypothetical protein